MYILQESSNKVSIDWSFGYENSKNEKSSIPFLRLFLTFENYEIQDKEISFSFAKSFVINKKEFEKLKSLNLQDDNGTGGRFATNITDISKIGYVINLQCAQYCRNDYLIKRKEMNDRFLNVISKNKASVNPIKNANSEYFVNVLFLYDLFSKRYPLGKDFYFAVQVINPVTGRFYKGYLYDSEDGFTDVMDTIDSVKNYKP